MKIVDRAVRLLAKELSLPPKQEEIIRYGAMTLACTATALAAIVVLSAAAGVFREAMAVTIASVIFRKTSGGAHSVTFAGCTIFSAAVMTLLGLVARFAWSILFSPSFLLLAVLVAGTAAYRFAPADVPQKPISSPRQRRGLRALSFLVVCAFALLGLSAFLAAGSIPRYVPGISLGLLWQSLMLTPAGFRLIAQADRLIAKISR